jgi:L-cysteine:1D-myo-inositol 2-amino-2-deoxy-alpha-D-glucopyranoside ligase
MFLYNSQTGTKEEFLIPTDRPVTIYVCGVTPYDTTHVGHARTYLFFDTLIRYIRWHNADVRYCQNVTDVDDPLFERAKRDSVDWRTLAERETERFVADFHALNMIFPDYFPKASEEIPGMIAIIEKLLSNGAAYINDGNVYFDISATPTFGSMARMGYDDLLKTANERGNTPNDTRKRDPLDFVLWQRSTPDEPAWESPWGPGRPGWHIECSAMSTHYLGPQIDIHGGGHDLLFPHHSCEIVQTECATGKHPFVRFWMHVGMVYLNGEKMSKSLGNLVFAREALKEHGPNALRWYLLSIPYRQEFFYEQRGVEEAHRHLDTIHRALHAQGGQGASLDVTALRNDVDAALADDMNTPLALTLIIQMANRTIVAADAGQHVEAAQAILSEVVHVLGLRDL